MKVLPILFNTEMVQAILDGRKIVTRRVIKDPYYIEDEEVCRGMGFAFHKGTEVTHGMPYPDELYRPGDILYVRETWKVQAAHRFEADARIVFKAGGPMTTINFPGGKSQTTSREEYDAFISKWMQGDRWHPSIHMPKEAARLFLRVENVKVERLQESFNAPTTPILEVQAEGIDIGDTCRECLEAYTWPCCVEALDDDGSTIGECGMLDENRGEFSNLWDSTIKPDVIDRYGWAANPWVWVIEFERCEKLEEVKA